MNNPITAWLHRFASTIAAASALRLAMACWAILFLVACTADAPHYGAFISTSQPASTTLRPGRLPVSMDDPSQPSDCPIVPASRNDGGNVDVQPNYTFATVEFDDSGRFYNPMQLTCLLQELHREAKKQPLILSVFVPGWLNEDTPNAPEVLAFRRMLHNAATHPPDRPAPRFVGIFVGWRTKAFKGSRRSILQVISYFNRRAAANHIANGEARTLFAKLTLFQQTQNQQHQREERMIRHLWVRQILIGHSFGATIVFHTLSAYAIQALDTEPMSGYYKPLFPSGTVGILINPAFSAARYKALYKLATQRCYPPDQKPVLIILSSRGDWPNKTAFPIGQMLNPTHTTSQQDNPTITREEAAAQNTAVGFYAPYINREIDYVTGPYLPAQQVSVDGQDEAQAVKCPQSEDPALEKTRPYLVPQGDWLNAAHHWDIKHLRGDPRNPFWVASVDPRLLSGHAVSFAPPFSDLLSDLFLNLTAFSRDGVAAMRYTSARP